MLKDWLRNIRDKLFVNMYGLLHLLYHPIVLSDEETIKQIVDNHKNFSHYGDGELGLMSGYKIGLQKIDKELIRKSA